MREKHLPFDCSQQLQFAENGRGTDDLNADEALEFFRFCKTNGHFVTWLETWVLLESGRRRLDMDWSMIDYFERDYSSVQLMEICEARLKGSIEAGLQCQYIFWV